MRYIVLFLTFILFGTACTEVRRSEKPDPFYDQEKMVEIITDMYLMEGSMSTNRKSFLETSIRPDSFLYKKHRMDSIGYVRNFNYYTDRIDEYEEILNLVEARLDKMKAHIDQKEVEQSILKPDIVAKDSILIDSIAKGLKKLPKTLLLKDKDRQE